LASFAPGCGGSFGRVFRHPTYGGSEWLGQCVAIQEEDLMGMNGCPKSSKDVRHARSPREGVMAWQVRSRSLSRRGRYPTKAVAGAALAVIFGCVVFSMPAEQLAWQGAYVMGALLLSAPASAPTAVTTAATATGSFYSFLGFVSVLGILGLATSRILPGPPIGWLRRLPEPHPLGPHWGLLIHHNVRPLR
jgi:hypothetical protein